MLFTNTEKGAIIFMPNQLNNAKRIIFYRDVIPFSQLQFVFDKNANSDSVVVKIILFRRVGLATIGVCVFCAVTSVAALFLFEGGWYKYNYKIPLQHWSAISSIVR